MNYQAIEDMFGVDALNMLVTHTYRSVFFLFFFVKAGHNAYESFEITNFLVFKPDVLMRRISSKSTVEPDIFAQM